MSGVAADRFAAAVDRLLLSCKEALTADELEVVQSQRDLIIQKQLVSPDIIRNYTDDQLMGFGFSPGTAAALKKAFPSIAAAPGQNVQEEFMTGARSLAKEMLRPFRLVTAVVTTCKPLTADVTWTDRDSLLAKDHHHAE